MASWTDSVKIDKLFKWMMNKSRGDNSAQFFEENINTSFDVHASEVWLDAIPTTPIDTANNGIMQKVTTYALTKDKKYSGNRVWVALKTWSSDWSSGSGDLNLLMRNFISNKYGKDYVVVVTDGSNNVIPELDNSSWLFDYRSGVLTFESDRTETGATQANSIKVTVYQYVGATLLDSWKGATVKSRTIEKFALSADGASEITLSASPRSNTLLDIFFAGILLEEGVDYNFDMASKKVTLLDKETYKDQVIVAKYF